MIMIPQGQEHAGLPWARWMGLLALLLTEILGLTLRFDAGDVPADRPMYRAITQTGRIARAGMTVGATVVIVAGIPCYRELTGLSGRVRLAGKPVAETLGNLVAFLSFYRLSTVLFDDARTPLLGWPLVVAWLLAGVAMLAFWGLAVLPAGTWVVLLRRQAGHLAVGMVVGGAAFATGQLTQNLWESFSRATLQAVHVLLQLVVSDTVCLPEQFLVGTSSFQIAISSECSGYEGLGLVGVLMAFALWRFRGELNIPRALAVVPLGMAITWLANATRIAALVLLGAWGYPGLAVQGFHSVAGLLLFLLIGLALVAAIRRLPFFLSRTSSQANAH